MYEISCCVGHADLGRQVAELIVGVQGKDWPALDEVWATFATDLMTHMAYEEADLFPDFAEEDSRNAAAVEQLRADHRSIRRRLKRLDEEIRLRLIDPGIIGSFVEELRDHARREDAAMHPWLELRRGVPKWRRAGIMRRPGPEISHR
jgi:hypothetical protein